MVRTFGCWMMGAGLLLAASAALATDPSIKCQTDKLRLAAKYTTCRLAAEAEAARTFSLPDFTGCESSYEAGWKKAEDRARAKGAPCWTEGDADVVKSDIDSQTDFLAQSLSGGK